MISMNIFHEFSNFLSMKDNQMQFSVHELFGIFRKTMLLFTCFNLDIKQPDK